MSELAFDLSTANLNKGDKDWDLIIIGAGPAGLSAAIYGARARIKTLVLEKHVLPGGQIGTTHLVEDYPGIKSIGGEELGKRMLEQAKSTGAHINLGEEVLNIDLENKIIKTTKNEYNAKAVILATGASERKLNVPGEKEYKGRGVSYCAVCDAPFFRDKNVVVIGGGNSALEESLYLAKFVKSLKIIHRRDSFRADKVIQERIFKNEKISIIWNSEVVEIKGNEHVTSIVLHNRKTDEKEEMDVDGVFIYIGMIPNTKLFDVEKDERGYILTNEKMETNVKGVYAAGDVRKSYVKQAITAAAEGAIAALMAEKYIENNKA